MSGRSIGALSLLCLFAFSGAAETKSWTGVVSTLWSAGGNWSGGTPPADGDDLVFPAAATAMQLTNDIAGLDLASIAGAGGPWTLSGNGFTVAGGVTSVALDLPVTLTASQTFSAVSVPANGTIHLNGFTLTLAAANEVRGTISGAGVIVLNGSLFLRSPALVIPGGAFVQNGPIVSWSGRIGGATMTGAGDIDASGGLPAMIRSGGVIRPGEPPRSSFSWLTTGSLTLNSGTVELDLAGTVSDHLIVNGTVTLNDVALVLHRRPVTPEPPGHTYVLIQNDGTDPVVGTFNGFPDQFTFEMDGVPFRIVYNGGPTGNDVVLITEPGGPKWWTGQGMNWSDGVSWTSGGIPPVDGDALTFPNLFMLNHRAFNDITGLDLDSLTFGADYTLSGRAITLTGGIASTISTNIELPIGLAASQTFRNVGIRGPLAMNGHTLTLAGNTWFDDAVSGSGAIFADGWLGVPRDGSMTFTGTLTNRGHLEMSGGSITGPAVVSSGTISGYGRLPAITQTGGLVTPDGVLSTGSLTFHGGTMEMDVKPNFGDHIAVTGTVTLDGMTLRLNLPEDAPSPGVTRFLIANDGTDPVAGTFSGLPQGATIAAGAQWFRIDYHGGSGNDVVLTTIPTTSTTLTASTTSPTVGQPVTLEAWVQSALLGVPTGRVRFVSGNETLATAALEASVARVTLMLGAGTFTIVAVYEGDGPYDPSTSAPITIESLAQPIPTLGELAWLACTILLAVAGVFAMRPA